MAEPTLGTGIVVQEALNEVRRLREDMEAQLNAIRAQLADIERRLYMSPELLAALEKGSR